MATKLTADQLERTEKLVGPIKTKTEEEARPKLVAFLGVQDVQGVESDPIGDLIDMSEVFYEEPAAPVAKKTAPAAKKTTAPVEEEEEEPTDITGGGEEEEEEELPVETKKTTAKSTVKPTVAANKPKVETKTAAKEKPAPIAGEKFDGRNNKKHLAFVEPFEAQFPAEDFEIFIAKNGLTVRVLGKNAKTTIINYDELKIVDGKFIGNLYTNRFKSVDDLLEVLPEEYHTKDIGMYRLESHPSVRRVSQDELFDIFDNSELLKISLERAGAKDVKMGINRERLEESLNQGKPADKKATAAAKKTTTKK